MRTPGGLAAGWQVLPPSSSLSHVRMGSKQADVVVRSEIGFLVAALARDLERFTGEAANPGWCWGYNGRPIRGTTDVYSFHAFGLAVDYNAPKHPLGQTGTWGGHASSVVNCAAHYGFRWGGSYSGRKDEMHFEYLGTPSQALAATRQLMAGAIPTPSVPPPASNEAPDFAALRKAFAFQYAASWPAQPVPMLNGTLSVALLRQSLNLIVNAQLDPKSTSFDASVSQALGHFQAFINLAAQKAGQHGIDDQPGVFGNTTKLWMIATLQNIAKGLG